MEVDEIMLSLVCVFFALIIIGLIIFGIGAVYDGIYISPIASDKANIHCKGLGFDFYESYKRVGIFSKTPIAVKCKYVEQYRKIDLNQPLIMVNS